MPDVNAIESEPVAKPELGLEEILERHRAALGGREALRATAVNVQEARLTGPNPQSQVQLSDELGNRLHVEVSVPELGLKVVQGFDGTLAWASGPMYEKMPPTSM